MYVNLFSLLLFLLFSHAQPLVAPSHSDIKSSHTSVQQQSDSYSLDGYFIEFEPNEDVSSGDILCHYDFLALTQKSDGSSLFTNISASSNISIALHSYRSLFTNSPPQI